MTWGELRVDTLRHLGDLEQRVWTIDAIDAWLTAGCRELTAMLHVLPDWTYVENLPRGFSYTHAWEADIVPFTMGQANYTAAFEADLLEGRRVGPANYTSPFEATDGLLARAGADNSVPATATLPARLTEIECVKWDQRTIDALSLSYVEARDTRYQLTEGEVYGYLWQQDGVRTLRKIRKPAAQAATWTVTGSWGLVRDADEVTS